MSIADLLQRVQQHSSNVELVYISNDQWPLASCGTGNAPLRIAVLDSSFNPPTLAHYALIRAQHPCSDELGDYDARLLLLSVRNADKSLKTGDATYLQRLEMMKLLAQCLEEYHIQNNESSANIAVAIIDEPTFVKKSKILKSFLQERIREVRHVQLHFIMGIDTLERFFAPRYYSPAPAPSDSQKDTTSSRTEHEQTDALKSMHSVLQTFFAPSPSGDDSKIICAHRIDTTSARRIENDSTTLQSPTPPYDNNNLKQTIEIAQPYIDQGNVLFINISDREQNLSSSEVRTRIARRLYWGDMVLPRVASYIRENGLYERT